MSTSLVKEAKMEQQSNTGEGVSNYADVFDNDRGVGFRGLPNAIALSSIKHTIWEDYNVLDTEWIPIEETVY